MLWSLVNRFTILPVEEYNETSSKFPDISLYPHFHQDSFSPIKCPKWEKWPFLCSIVSFLDEKRTFIYLQVELDIIDIHQQHSIWTSTYTVHKAATCKIWGIDYNSDTLGPLEQQHLRNGVVAVNQTRSQIEEISGNLEHHA